MLGSEGGENRVENRPKTSLSTPGFCNLFSPSPPFQLLTKAATSYTTWSQHNDQPTTKQPSRLSLSSPSSLSLSSATFSSSSHSRLRPPSPQSTPPEPSAKPSHHARDPTPGNFLLPASPLSSSSWLLHVVAN